MRKLAEMFLELEEDLELVRAKGWKMRGDGSVSSWRAWVDTVGYDVARVHKTAANIVKLERERIRRGMEENRRLNKETGIMKGRIRVSELELKGKRQGRKRLEEELEGLRK